MFRALKRLMIYLGLMAEKATETDAINQAVVERGIRDAKAKADKAHYANGQLAGQILAYQLLGEQAVPVESRLKFVRLGTGGLSGWHPWRGEVVERTGAKVIAVERAGEVFVEFPDDFQMTPDDVLIVCGTLESIERFQQEFQSLPLAARQGRRQP